jgi:predicted nicotinamide N-methyase
VHQAFVLTHTRLAPVPQLPEIRLHQADDAFTLWEETERHTGLRELPPPFWAFAWPGGQALARYLLDNPGIVAGRVVLDLGAGSGLTTIAAALAGASAVLASELDPFAVAAIGLNAAANDVQVTVTGDLLDGAGEAADIVLAADIWYERHLAERALGLLQRARERGATALVGDVGRAFLPRTAMRVLASYDVPVAAAIEDAPTKHALVCTLS